ncbi:putative endoplasmic reticulum protein [Naematelia encephala]|uniref:ER membrane protein complex subunit 1 n=1 Tax=Naematelia encephala TaxID=71784 RepID=A0A1Y2AQY7_9TREE|nr:putative endoplasmic reticulum protein [Naematelia encephala]
MKLPLGPLGLLLPIILAQVAVALQANLAGIVDWHKPLIGPPLLEPTPPVLVETSNGPRIVAITRKNVVAALNADNGDITWRHLLEDDDPVVSFHIRDDNLLLLSGPSATTARLLSLSTGHVLWERPLHADSEPAKLTVPAHLGTDAAFTDEVDGSVVILSDGRRVSKLALKDGTPLWSLDAPGVGSTVLFKQILVSGDTVHVLALTSGFRSNTLTTLSLSLTTSAPLGDFTQIPGQVIIPSEGLLAASSTPGAARVLWFEYNRIRSAFLSPQGQLGEVKEIFPAKGRVFKGLFDVGLRNRGYILGKAEDGAVSIVDVRQGAAVVDTFESSNDSPERSDSIYSASVSKDGTIIINRVYWSFKLNLGLAQNNQITKGGTAISSGFTFPFDTSSHGVILGAAVSSTVNAAQLPVLMLTTSSGALQLIQGSSQVTAKWTREESLAEIAEVRFIELGEPEVEEVRHLLADESFFGRLTRHIAEFQALPSYVFRFVRRLFFASYTSAQLTKPLTPSTLHRDQFGFQKLVIAVTKGGKVFALDSTNGNILWSKNLGLSNVNGNELSVEGVWVVRGLGDTGNPQFSVLAVRTKQSGQETTVAYTVDAYTGDVTGGTNELGLPAGKELFDGKSQTAFLLPFENCGSKNRVLAVLDSASQLYIYPSCKKVASDLAEIKDKLFFTTSSRSIDSTTLVGSSPSVLHDNITFSTTPLWSSLLGPGETILEITPADMSTVASYGRVLGDKSTLYKYLNPHLSVVTSFTPAEKLSHVYVIDTTTGQRVYGIEVQGSGIKAAMVENWLVFAWAEASGWRIGSVELYETPDLSSSSSLPVVKSISETFIIPGEVRAIGFTRSKFGITAKELVYVNGLNQVVTVPRRLLDPRRHVGKPTAGDKEEMLIPYDPFIGIDPKRVISHQNQVLGANHLESSPALVESTSLLLAYGLDLFLTRGLTPSGSFDILSDNFNKAQLLLTLAGLTGGILVAGPAVRRKNLRARWY